MVDGQLASIVNSSTLIEIHNFHILTFSRQSNTAQIHGEMRRTNENMENKEKVISHLLLSMSFEILYSKSITMLLRFLSFCHYG